MSEQQSPPERRKVGFLLGVGIFFLPIIFAWFVLRKGYSTLVRAVSFVWLAVVVLLYIAGANAPPVPESTTTSSPTTEASADSEQGDGTPQAVPQIESTRSNWRYDETRDEMRGTTAKYASVVSENELDFEFPYGRGNSTTLTIRRDGELDAFLVIEKGQFLCNGFSDSSYVSVKFDDGPIQRFNCTDTSDGRSDTAFIRNAPRLLEGLRGADQTIIEAEFYQEGRRQIIFNTAGLEWD